MSEPGAPLGRQPRPSWEAPCPRPHPSTVSLPPGSQAPRPSSSLFTHQACLLHHPPPLHDHLPPWGQSRRLAQQKVRRVDTSVEARPTLSRIGTWGRMHWLFAVWNKPQRHLTKGNCQNLILRLRPSWARLTAGMARCLDAGGTHTAPREPLVASFAPMSSHCLGRSGVPSRRLSS